MTQVDCQLSAEKQTRAMKSCLDGGNGQSEHHGNFFIRHSLHVAENHCAFVHGLQLLQSIVQQLLQFPFGVFFIQCVGPIDHRPHQVVAVLSETLVGTPRIRFL